MAKALAWARGSGFWDATNGFSFDYGYVVDSTPNGNNSTSVFIGPVSPTSQTQVDAAIRSAIIKDAHTLYGVTLAYHTLLVTSF